MSAEYMKTHDVPASQGGRRDARALAGGGEVLRRLGRHEALHAAERAARIRHPRRGLDDTARLRRDQTPGIA